MMGSGLGVRRMTASSMASRTIRIRMRTFTSQVSQFRSSEMECMKVSLQPSAVIHQSFGASPRHSEQLIPDGCLLFFLSRQFCDHREQWHVQRDHNAADADAEE